MDTYCIQVILPIKLGWAPFYYSHKRLETGQCVSVEFARRRYFGVVWNPDVQPVDSRLNLAAGARQPGSGPVQMAADKIQEILAVEYDMPRISAAEIKLWEFLSQYYLCTIGEVYKAAYPSLKLRSEQVRVSELDRLREKLAKCEAQLAGRHCERVMERLKAERDETAASLAEASSGVAGKSQPDGERADGDAGKPMLVRGIDRIGKYLQATSEAIGSGRQVLILTPEIAFCSRMESLMRPEFGDKVAIVNSTKTPTQRNHVERALREGRPMVVIGTRSAIFLPFSSLSLVIIDEEQDPSYKQTEPAPRYNGRDAAVALAGIHGAAVILGSAVPSFESLYNCSIGKYILADVSSPTRPYTVVDIPSERRKNGMIGNFSRKLIAEIGGEGQAVAEEDAAEGSNIIFVRGWEKPDELGPEVAALFPDCKITIATLGELKRMRGGRAKLLAVIQADALVSKDDFRSDERALQLISLFQEFASRVIIQTAVPARFNASRDVSTLMSERREFGFPPFTRLVEVKRQGSCEILERHFFKRDASLRSAKAELAASLQKGCYLDVDP